MNRKFNWERFDSVPIIGIMRNFPHHQMEPAINEFYKAGFTTLEIAMNSVGAIDTIKEIAANWGDKINIGAGTVCSMSDLDKALNAGATFIVSPVVNAEVIKACVAADVPVIPGALSPTEIYTAWTLGASMVKVFPASRLGPGYIKDVLEPLNTIKLAPTGGIDQDNFIDYLKAGATGLGIASSLFPKDIIANEDWDKLSVFLNGFIGKYHAYKNENA